VENSREAAFSWVFNVLAPQGRKAAIFILL
jgi:hypothetical protein